MPWLARIFYTYTLGFHFFLLFVFILIKHFTFLTTFHRFNALSRTSKCVRLHTNTHKIVLLLLFNLIWHLISYDHKHMCSWAYKSCVYIIFACATQVNEPLELLWTSVYSTSAILQLLSKRDGEKEQNVSEVKKIQCNAKSKRIDLLWLVYWSAFTSGFHTSEICSLSDYKKYHTHAYTLRLYDDQAALLQKRIMWENTYRIFFIYLLRATKVYDSRCPLPLRYFIFVVVVVVLLIMLVVVSFTNTRLCSYFVLYLVGHSKKDYYYNNNYSMFNEMRMHTIQIDLIICL